MSATKKDLRAQKRYMMETKTVYLSKKNPHRITLTEFNKRIATINRMIKFASNRS
jgi:hypothetical protein